MGTHLQSLKSNLQIKMSVGKDSKYIKLIAEDGHVFYIKRSVALVSGTLKAMLSGPSESWAETQDQNKIVFKAIPSHVLARVCDYFNYKAKYTNTTSEIPEFPVDPDMALEVLMAANFLDC